MKVTISKRDKDALEYAIKHSPCEIFAEKKDLEELINSEAIYVNKTTLRKSREILETIEWASDRVSDHNSLWAIGESKEERAERIQAYMRLEGLHQKAYKAIRQAKGSRP